MQPSNPSRSFQWPHVDDICWVPNDHSLCKIEIPITSSRRFYSILEHDRKVTEEQFHLINSKSFQKPRSGSI